MDRVNNADVSRIAAETFSIIDKMQYHVRDHGAAKDEQVLAVAYAFKIVTDTLGLDMGRMLSAAGNLMTDANGKYIPEFKAFAMYVEKELT